jgi:hypothetical protein
MQPITIGPDQTICQGQTATFTLPAGFPNYLWSTGATSQSLTTGTAGPLWGQVSYPTGNLIANGDFSAGNTGFTSTFLYTTNLQPDATYYVGFNAAAITPFVGWGAGLFLIGDGGTAQVGWNVWNQGVSGLCRGRPTPCRSIAAHWWRTRRNFNGSPGVAYGPVFTRPPGPMSGCRQRPDRADRAR